MRYVDKKYGFSFDIPEGWRQVRKSFIFWVTGGKVSMTPKAEDANINVSCGNVIRGMEKVQRRAIMLEKFLDNRGYEVIQLGIENAQLSGEKNVVDAIYRDPKDREECLASKISVIHNGLEYVITFGGNYQRYGKDLETVTDSFKF